MTSIEFDTAVEAINEVIDQRAVQSLFQPLVYLPTAEVIGFEALTRGPTGSPVESPVALLNGARAAGRLAELDWICAATAYRAAAAAELHPSMSVFLNFEPSTLFTPCPSDLLGLARRAQDHLRVFVEIKEDCVVADPGGTFDALTQVREIGWGVAIDNAAASPESLALLPLMHPDVIKLDLRRLGTDNAAIAKMSDGARLYSEQTGAMILAEGLEESDDVLLARAVGAEFGQGWYFGRPEPLSPTQSVPYAVFPLLTAPPMDICATPFEIVKERCRTAISEKRFLQPFRTYLEEQIDTNGPPALLLVSFDRAADMTIQCDRLAHLVSRSAFTVALGPNRSVDPQSNLRTLDVHDNDPFCAEWNIIVLGPHYAGALIAHGLGDDGGDDYRRFEYAITHDRELILAAARSFLRRVDQTSSERIS